MFHHHQRGLRFSHKAIENLPTPSEKPAEYSDQIAVGLRIYVGTSGAKRWRYRYRFEGKAGVIVLGKFPSMSLEKARTLAREKEAMIGDGIDPKLEKLKRRECPTFKEFTEEVFIPYAKRELRGIKDTLNRINNKLIPRFGDMKLIHIRREHVAAMVEDLAAKISGTTANRTRSLLSSILEKAIDYGHIEVNPTKQVRRCKENGPRVTFMCDDETSRFHKELLKEVDKKVLSAEALYLIFLTGMRRTEALSLTWKQIDLDNCLIHIPNPKNGIAKTIPLNSFAVGLIKDIQRERGTQSSFLFPGRGKTGHLTEVRKTLKALKERANVAELVTHDLRRLFASALANQGESLRNIGALLGHKNLKTTEKVYAHLTGHTLRASSEKFVEKLNSLAA